MLSVLYVCIILGIFALQFTGGRAFSLAVGPFMVSSSSIEDPSGVSRPVAPIHVGAFGLDFFMDGQHPLVARRQGGEAVDLELTGVADANGRLVLSFSRDVSLSFDYEKRGDIDVVSVTARLPESLSRVDVPYRLSRSAKLEKKDSSLLVSSSGKLFSFPGRALDEAPPSAVRRLAIARQAPVVYYQTWLPAKGLSLQEYASLPGSSQGDWSRATERFAASALAVFRDRIASGSFIEAVAAAYVAEMGRIGMYRSALDSVPESFIAGSSRTWLTSTYFNDLERKWAQFMTRERDERTAISRRLTEGNPAAFEFPSLASYLVDRGSEVLLDDLIRVAGGVEIASLTPLQAAGLLECLMDMHAIDPDRARSFASLAESCERTVAASLSRQGDSLFLVREGKVIETIPTFRVASILIRYGNAFPERAQWKPVGYRLATSLLALSGDVITLPASFTLSPEGVKPAGDAMLGPSSLYPVLFPANTWYPRAQSLASAERGLWAWTSALEVAAVKTDKDTLKLTVRFPLGETHYMVVRGVKPFSRIEIYGMDFRTDPRFESYNSSGYRYNAETETLYLKMRHKSEYEDVIIHFGAPNLDTYNPTNEGSPQETPVGEIPEGGTQADGEPGGAPSN